MSWYDFLLFVHVLGAFAVIGASSWFWALTIASMKTDRASTVLALGRMVPPATGVVIFGSAVVLIFGIWLVLYIDLYDIFDFWIIASIVLWAVASETGRRGGQYHQQTIPPLVESVQSGRDEITPEWKALPANRMALTLDVVSSLAVFLILVLMIFKPGV